LIKKQMTLGGRELSIETGRMAKQASGSVVVRYGDAMVLVTATANFMEEAKQSFFPLQVEYREKTYAAGKIPGGFFKREGRPSEKEILAARLIDRPIRPLFKEGFFSETQIIANLISSDQVNPGDVLGITGASAALCISQIPFLGPIAGVRVGYLNEEFIINPTIAQIEELDLEIIVAGNEESVVMVEGEAKEVSEDVLVDAIKFGHEAIKELVEFQKELIAEVNPEKVTVQPDEIPTELRQKVTEKTESHLDEWWQLGTQSKSARSMAIAHFVKDLKAELEEEYPEQGGTISELVDELLKADMRKHIRETQKRLGDRSLMDIRSITCEVGVLPKAHGSALFTRGETQSLASTTLGTKIDEQIIDEVECEEFKKRFTLHYNFPPFSVGEVRWMRGPGRREIGHGNLAERALKLQAPSEADFPYTIRIVSDILESNGSSSMASVCAGSLALMDAGVPVQKTVAGIAMGLIKEENETFILSDILGTEDHYGDMDFKVAGTRDGITAIQMDLKVKGISTQLMRKALEQAREGRVSIIDIMEKTLKKSRPEIAPHAPKILTMQIEEGSIGDIIGPGGKTIREIQEKSGATVEIDDDGRAFISAPNTEAAMQAKDMIERLLVKPEEGEIYRDCPVKRLESYGAFVEFLPKTEGLLHISEIEWKRTNDINDVLKVGDKVDVKLKKIAGPGRFELSIRELLDKPAGYEERKPRYHKRGSHRSSDRRNRDRNK